MQNEAINLAETKMTRNSIKEYFQIIKPMSQDNESVLIEENLFMPVLLDGQERKIFKILGDILLFLKTVLAGVIYRQRNVGLSSLI